MRKYGHPLAAVLLITTLLTAAQPASPAKASAEVHFPQGQLSNVSIGAAGDPATNAVRSVLASQPRQTFSGRRTAANLSPVPGDSGGAAQLASAAFDGGYASARFISVPPNNGTHAVVSDLGGFPSDGSTAALLTTGDSRWATEPNNWDSSGSDAGAPGPYDGSYADDVTRLAIEFDVPSGHNCLNVNFRFYSEEVPEYTRGAYNDAFIAELDTTSWKATGATITAPNNFVHDRKGNLVSVNTSGAVGMDAQQAAGTTYDGATPVMGARTPVSAGRHTLYLSIFDMFDQYFDTAVILDKIGTSQTSDCKMGLVDPARPIVFLHGIMGSKLNLLSSGREAWPRWVHTGIDPDDSHFQLLHLKDDGFSNCDNYVDCGVEVGSIIRKAPIDFYDGTLKFFERNGFRENRNLFVFAYDWRRSVAYNGILLLARIDEILAQTGADKVNIIAHSQGGQVTQAALGMIASKGKVNRVVTIGTPVLGAAQALGVLRYEDPCMAVEIMGGCTLNRKAVAKMGRNLSGLHDLLPSQRYWSEVGSPVIRTWDSNNDGKADGEMDLQQVHKLIETTPQSWGANLPLIQRAAQWHDANDVWTPADPEVALVRVVGTGYSTIESINDKRKEVCMKWIGCKWVEDHSFNYGTGDGIVPESSAAYRGGTGNTATFMVKWVNHQELPLKEHVLTYALETVRQNGPLGTATNDPTGYGITGVVAPAGISLNSTPLTGTQLDISGTAHGLLTDADGWRSGVIDPATEQVVRDIRGSSYTHTGDYASAFLTSDQASGRWTATGDGELRFTLRSYVDNVIARTIPYPPVQVNTGAVVKLSSVAVPLPTTPPSLEVDDNADGVTDRTVAPLAGVNGMTAGDNIGPISTISLQRYTATDGTARVRITLNATDEGGAGVDRLEWAHVSSTAVLSTGTYTTVFDLPATGTLKVRATDKAGNVESKYPSISLA